MFEKQTYKKKKLFKVTKTKPGNKNVRYELCGVDSWYYSWCV